MDLPRIQLQWPPTGLMVFMFLPPNVLSLSLRTPLAWPNASALPFPSEIPMATLPALSTWHSLPCAKTPRPQLYVALASPQRPYDATTPFLSTEYIQALAAKQGVWTDPRKRHNRTMPFSERNIFLAKGKIFQRGKVLLL